MLEYYGIEMQDNNELEHYGKGHLDGGHSGRYPWGSGEQPFQDDPRDVKKYDSPKAFIEAEEKMKKSGITESERAKAFDLETASELRAALSVARAVIENEETDKILKMRDQGMSLREIAKSMGYSEDKESTIRNRLKNANNQKIYEVFEYANIIKDGVDKYGLIDVGEGAETYLGCSPEKFAQAVYILKTEYGYQVKGRRIQQMTNKGQYTTVKVACPPDAPDNILFDQDIEHRIRTLENIGNGKDPNQNFNIKPSFNKPTVIDRKRVGIRYAEEGGIDKDGLIEIRPGIKDLSLSGAMYSQVRIAVNDEEGNPKYYLKGMAVYSDDIPDGIDLIVNTNKKIGTSDSDTFKKLKTTKDGEIDWNNPFGSNIKEKGGQYWYLDDEGNSRLGLINKRADEGDWLDWSNKIPAQFLSKQSPAFVKQHLNYTITEKEDEFEEIKKLDNPAIKMKFLDDFAGGLDSQAVHLKAASLPRQKYEVLLPMPSLKDNECYATNFENGTKLALIRFPHAGPFEIPIVNVNNKNKEGIKMIGKQSQDAIGINKHVADILSGADFDGDTVIAIPISDKVAISSRHPLKGLENFDNKASYPPKKKLDENGAPILDEKGEAIIISPVMSKKVLQREMGQVSNLITDMTLMGASDDEIARAVRHSMVVVDAPKHKLDYRKSEIDNGISELKRKYQLHDWTDWQGTVHKDARGASTIISRAKAQVSAPEYEGYYKINPETGKIEPSRKDYKMVFDYANSPYEEIQVVDKETGELKTIKKFDYKHGTYKVKTRKSNWMSEVEDAAELVRDRNNPIEMAYAKYANALKDLANEVRKEYLKTPKMKYNPESAKKYSEEVNSLNSKLLESKKNAPREREAQVLANIKFEQYINGLVATGEEMDKEEEKKIRDRFIKQSREICGARRYEIEISDKEWEAIQNGAITHTKAEEIFSKANLEKLYERAMPKEGFKMTEVKERRIQSLYQSGYTSEEIAKAVGASVSTITQYLKERR